MLRVGVGICHAEMGRRWYIYVEMCRSVTDDAVDDEPDNWSFLRLLSSGLSFEYEADIGKVELVYIMYI